MLADMDRLPKLFRDFQLDGAECFCCSCKHKHPVSMEDVPCDRELIYAVLQHWSGVSEDTDINSVFKKHLDDHVMPLVERSFHSTSLLRPLMSAALVASSPFVGDFMSVEFTNFIKQNAQGNAVREAGLPIYVFFISLCLVRCSLLLGRLGVRWKRNLCFIPIQVLSFLLISLVLGVGYSFAVAFGTRSFDYSAINLLPFFLLALMMLWSLLSYVHFPCRLKSKGKTKAGVSHSLGCESTTRN